MPHLVLYPLARVCVPCSVKYLTPWALCWVHVYLVPAGDTCRVSGAACPAPAPASSRGVSLLSSL